MVQENTFKGTVLSFPNNSIHLMLNKIMTFRIQLVQRPEFRSQSGWNDAMNKYMQDSLEKIHDLIQVNTVKKGVKTQEELEAEVSDTTKTLAESYDENTFAQDEILGGAHFDKPIVWDLSGADVNIPQPTVENFPNGDARAFITQLDYMFRQLTRLDSRFNSAGIEKYDSTIIVTSFLEPLWSSTMRFGGEVNRVDTPEGVLPSDEPNTFQG